MKSIRTACNGLEMVDVPVGMAYVFKGFWRPFTGFLVALIIKSTLGRLTVRFFTFFETTFRLSNDDQNFRLLFASVLRLSFF